MNEIGCWISGVVGIAVISFLAWIWRMIQEEERLWNVEKGKIEAELEKSQRREERVESIILEGIKIEKVGQYTIVRAHSITEGYLENIHTPMVISFTIDKYGVMCQVFASREEAMESAEEFCVYEEEHGGRI